MRIGIGLPNAIQGVDRESLVLEARAAEAAGFSTVTVVDRLSYLTYEPLTTLAAVAAVTERVELMTNVLLAPLHANAALLAKQAATVDQLSQGRLVLGLGVGGVKEDFELSELDYHRRGRTVEDQLTRLRTLWAGEGVGTASGEAIGPSPYGGRRLPILIGGHVDQAYRRAAEHGDGWTSPETPDGFAEGAAKMRAAWAEAGRDGAPRLIAAFWFALGEAALGVADANLDRFYNAAGREYQDWVLQSAARTPHAVRQAISAYEQAGADDVICMPASTDPSELDRVANIVL